MLEPCLDAINPGWIELLEHPLQSVQRLDGSQIFFDPSIQALVAP
jgi:hypothetical protein